MAAHPRLHRGPMEQKATKAPVSAEAFIRNLEAEQEEIKSMITQAASVAKSIGSLPGSLSFIIKDLLEPKVDWRALLAEFLTRQFEPDYDWRRPSKRYVHMGTYIPSIMPSQQQGSIAVAIDTSGSISDEELRIFLSELSHLIAQSFIHEVHFYQCDADIKSYEVVSKWNLPLEGKITGRGGTDFRPVFQHIAENRCAHLLHRSLGAVAR